MAVYFKWIIGRDDLDDKKNLDFAQIEILFSHK